MNRLYESGDFSSSCSSESEDGSSTDDECHEKSISKKRTTEKADTNGSAARKSIPQNILFKLQNREVCAYCTQQNPHMPLNRYRFFSKLFKLFPLFSCY